MPLETTMICLDNSEWMRNGDHMPCRLDAQQDAVTMLVRDRYSYYYYFNNTIIITVNYYNL